MAALSDSASKSTPQVYPKRFSIHRSAAVWCPALANEFIFALFLLEAVVVRELLADLDILARKKDQVRMPIHLQNLCVHAGRAAMILHKSRLG